MESKQFDEICITSKKTLIELEKKKEKEELVQSIEQKYKRAKLEVSLENTIKNLEENEKKNILLQNTFQQQYTLDANRELPQLTNREEEKNYELKSKYEESQKKYNEINDKFNETKEKLERTQKEKDDITLNIGKLENSILEIKKEIKKIKERPKATDQKDKTSYVVTNLKLEPDTNDTDSRISIANQRSSHDNFNVHTRAFNFTTQIYSIQFSHIHVAVGGADKHIHIISKDSYQLIKDINPNSGVLCLSYNQSCSYLLAGLYDGSWHLYDKSYNDIFQSKIHSSPIISCEFMSDEKIITASRDRKIIQFDLRAKKPISSITCNSLPTSLCMGSRSVIASYNDGYIRGWDMRSAQFTFEKKMPRQDIIQVLKSGPDRLLTYDPKNCYLFDESELKRLKTHSFPNYTSNLNNKASIFNGDFYIGDEKGNIHKINTDSWTDISINSGENNEICCLGAQNGLLVVGHGNGKLNFLNSI